MPEVFNNHYTFANRETVPSAETVREHLSKSLGVTLTSKAHSASDHGAPRAWAEMEAGEMHAYAFWEADRPVVEIQVDEPIQRMFAANAAMISLGGSPKEDDDFWRRRIHGGKSARVTKFATAAIVFALAVLTIWHWGWWGLAAVVALTVAAAIVFTLGLARAFSRG